MELKEQHFPLTNSSDKFITRRSEQSPAPPPAAAAAALQWTAAH